MTGRRWVAPIAALLLAACDWMPIGDGPQIDGAWELEQGTYDGAPITVPAGARITLTITGEELGGTAACNAYGGTADLQGWAIEVAALSMTEMACEEPLMAAESAYLAALADVDTVEQGRSLWLTGPSSDLRFRVQVPVADADLVGTTWTLDSIVTGDAVASVMGEPATLELRDDGTLAGSTGCRTFTGDYVVGGDGIEVTQLVTDDRACADALAAQDDHVLAVIGDGFTVAVAGSRLTLMDGANGLGYTAEP